MYKFKKILVGLDQSSMDHDLLAAVCTICQLSGSSDIYFMNILRDFHVPDDVLKEFPDLLNKALEQRKSEIESAVNDNFSCPGVNIHIEIKQGQPTREIMRFAEDKKVDLVVVGRKNEKKGGGIMINRVARRISCSLLVIPRGSKLPLKRMLVPIDFSSYSLASMEKAIELSVASKDSHKIIAQNVFQVPSGYHYTGKTYDEFAEIMKQNAEKDYNAFIKKIDTSEIDIEPIYTLDKEEDVIAHIYRHAKTTKADTIIIGAKGRTTVASLLIGSKAEKLIHMDSDIPIIVVRPKGKVAGFRESLREL